MLYQFVADLGVEGIRDEMGAAHALFASGSEVVRDKEGAETPRALGGIFIRLCKRRICESDGLLVCTCLMGGS